MNADDFLGAVVVECEMDWRDDPKELTLRLSDGRLICVAGGGEDRMIAWEKDT